MRVLRKGVIPLLLILKIYTLKQYAHVYLPLHFQMPVLVCVGLWGWTLVVHLLTMSGINVPCILAQEGMKQNSLVPALYQISAIYSGIVLFFITFIPDFVIVLHFLFIFLTFCPFKVAFYSQRMAFTKCLYEISFNSLKQPVKFRHIVLSDILTSFGPILGDLPFILFHFTGQESNTVYETLQICSAFIISVFPMLRIKQCAAEYLQTRQTRHLLNAIKYFSSLPVIFTSFRIKILLKQAEFSQIESLLVVLALLAVVNSVYSFIWDVKVDWGLEITKNPPRETMKFPKLIYFIAVFFNFLSRLSWIMTLSAILDLVALQKHSTINMSLVSLFLRALEVYRRSVWLIFRIEKEAVNFKLGQQMTLEPL